MSGRHTEPPTPLRTTFLAVSDDERWRAEALTLALRQAVTCVDGLGSLIHRRERASGRLRLVAASGLTRDRLEAWTVLSALAESAPTRAMRCGAFVWVAGDSLGVGASGAGAVPLPGAEGPIGALSVLTSGSHEPDDVQRSFLRSVAVWTTQHVENRPPVSAGADETDWSVRVGELTMALTQALSSTDVVRAVAEHVLPPLGADGLGIHAFEGGRLRTVGLVGHPQQYHGYWSQLQGLPLTSHPIIGDVLRTGTPLLIETKAELLRRYPEMAGLTANSPKNAWVFLPLIASGHPIGCCVVSFARSRSFSKAERTVLSALSGLVAQGLERARLYDAEHARAQGLQRGLLPRTLPELPAVRAAARYLPAGRGDEVGGDWYDVVPLSADRVAMVIGDVMGHGITEAATMGRLRTAVRTLADLEMPPDELLSHLNDLVSELGEDSYATCLYAVFDPVTRTCAFSLAGHPPPVIVHPDGTVHSPDLAADPPLGAAEPPFSTHELHVPHQSLLVFFTDGLIESSTRDFDQGLAQLRRILLRTPYFRSGERNDDYGGLEDLCDTITSELLPDREQTDDDAALLIVHTRGTAADDIAVCGLPEHPRAAGQAREYIRKQLAVWGLTDLIVTTELLVSELVGNAVRHAKGPLSLRLLRSRSLICEVYDGSLTTPRIRRAASTDEGGRGLQLVTALSQRWGTRYLHDGKSIWTEQDLPR